MSLSIRRIRPNHTPPFSKHPAYLAITLLAPRLSYQPKSTILKAIHVRELHIYTTLRHHLQPFQSPSDDAANPHGRVQAIGI